MASWLGLHWLDWLVLLIYLFGVTAIGIWAMRKVKDVTDFFMGGRRFGKVFMMFFAFGSGTHSEQAVGVVGGDSCRRFALDYSIRRQESPPTNLNSWISIPQFQDTLS